MAKVSMVKVTVRWTLNGASIKPFSNQERSLPGRRNSASAGWSCGACLHGESACNLEHIWARGYDNMFVHGERSSENGLHKTATVRIRAQFPSASSMQYGRGHRIPLAGISPHIGAVKLKILVSTCNDVSQSSWIAIWWTCDMMSVRRIYIYIYMHVCACVVVLYALT